MEEEKEQYYKKVAKSIIPKIYEKIDNKKELNFIIWSSDEHKSLVVECNGNYYFLDSCGYYFRRFPEKEHNREAENNIFYINSQVQADDFNCGSYCFEFMKQVIDIYKEKGNTKELNKYLKEYFSENGHEYCVEHGDANKSRTHGLLPPELLQYFQSLAFLRNISVIILEEIEENIKNLQNEIKTINEKNNELIEQKNKLINDINKEKTEEKYSVCSYNSIEEQINDAENNLANIEEQLNNKNQQIKKEESGKQKEKLIKERGELIKQRGKFKQERVKLINKREEFPQYQRFIRSRAFESNIVENNKSINEYQQQLEMFETQKQLLEKQITPTQKKLNELIPVLQDLPEGPAQRRQVQPINIARKKHLNNLDLEQKRVHESLLQFHDWSVSEIAPNAAELFRAAALDIGKTAQENIGNSIQF